MLPVLVDQASDISIATVHTDIRLKMGDSLKKKVRRSSFLGLTPIAKSACGAHSLTSDEARRIAVNFKEAAL